jgi:thiol-disulfide isomerase/thioredoxin
MGPEKIGLGMIGRLGMFCCLLIFVLPVLASTDPLRLELSNGDEVEITRFRGGDATTILWLPSERGFSAAHQFHGAALAGLGHEVWLADLHSTYFVQPGRGSIAQFPLDDIVALIDAAVAASPGRVLLLSSSRGAQLALIAAREWQLSNPGDASLAGIVLAHAHLYGARPAPGQGARYLPIVQSTNLPVFLLAAEYSTKSSRLGELADALGTGGSRVYTQLLAGVRGGFDTRETALNSDRDEAAKLAFAATLDRAISLLTRVKPPAGGVLTSRDTRQFGRSPRAEPVLTALASPLAAPSLRLTDLDGRPFKLEDHAGRVVLVNFWASWCRPCVTEIPSLHRLDAAMADDDFKIVTVNVGEDRERVLGFLQQVPVELPVLMDYDASTSKDWMIYVYPSSYLVDHQGKIRYAYLGALEWDSIENLKIVRSLLSKR